MSRFFALALLAAASLVTVSQAAAPTSRAQPNAELKVIDTFHIGGATRWDYPVVDSDAHRLYLACDTHLQIVDTQTGKKIGDIGGLNRAHGTAVVPEKGIGFVTSGLENAIVAFDLKTFDVKKKIATSGDGGRSPDAIIYDPASKKVFAFCAGGHAVAIDPANLDAAPVAIDCGGKLEYGRVDGKGKLFVNNEDKSEINVIDTKALKLIERWPLAPLETPTGLAIDLPRHRLYTVGKNHKMAIVDFQNGKLLGTAEIGEGPDGCAFDGKLGAEGLALSSNGRDGTVTVVAETAPGKFVAVQTIKTAVSGRTIAGDPSTNRIYVPAVLTAGSQNADDFGVIVLGAAN